MGNLYLVGMMGSGKSVTGQKLAQMLNYPFVDLDDCLQEKLRRTIADIFSKEGEPFFRVQETEVLKKVSGSGPQVVATGGGAVLNAENIRRMHETGKIIYLETSLETLWQRVRGRDERPLLKTQNPKETLAGLLDSRRAIYERESDFTVNTDGQTAEVVAEKIYSLLEKKN